MSYSFTKCPLCGFVEELGNNDAPCSNCKKPANNDSENLQELRVMWPTPTEFKYLKTSEVLWEDLRKKRAEKYNDLIKSTAEIPEIKSKSVLSKAYILSIFLDIEYIYEQEKESDEIDQKILGEIKSKLGENTPRINEIANQIFIEFLSTVSFKIHEINFIVVITCTFIENLFDRLLIEILNNRGTPNEIAISIVKEIKSIRTKTSLLKRLTEQKLSTVLKQSPFKTFYRAWEDIGKKRNAFIHGNPYSIKLRDAKKAHRITSNAVEVFAYLHNKFCVKN